MSKAQRIRSLDQKAKPLIEAAAALTEHSDNDSAIYKIAVATNIESQSFFNLDLSSFEAVAQIAAGLPITASDGLTYGFPVEGKNQMWVYTAGPLEGGEWQHSQSLGAYRRATNIAGFYLACIDLDKGHATQLSAYERLVQLDWLGATCVTFSDGATTHKAAWRIRKIDRKTGLLVTLPGAFAHFCNGREPTAALAKAFMVEEGYCPDAIGAVELRGLITGDPSQVGIDQFAFRHDPIPKVRIVVGIPPFLRMPGEPLEAFKHRWQNYYHRIAATIGFPYDRSCDTLERAFFGITHNQKLARPVAPLIHRGRLVAQDDASLVSSVSLEKSPKQHEPQLESQRARTGVRAAAKRNSRNSGQVRKLWRGFRAADAAAALWSDVTDKRKERGLVAVECPFVDEHTTSNKPGTRQCALFNPPNKHSTPYARCFADTCQGRPTEEFLEALFTPHQRHSYR